MFSFFKTHKKSPVVSPTTEHKTEENTQKNGDDFVVVGGNQSNFPTSPVYPPLNPAPPPPQHPTSLNRQFSMTANYTNAVPFKLNPSLVSSNNDSEVWNFKIREMVRSLLFHEKMK